MTVELKANHGSVSERLNENVKFGVPQGSNLGSSFFSFLSVSTNSEMIIQCIIGATFRLDEKTINLAETSLKMSHLIDIFILNSFLNCHALTVVADFLLKNDQNTFISNLFLCSLLLELKNKTKHKTMCD